MNINYTTGDTIRNSDNLSQYMPPAQRPTEEWAGGEVRSYQNYIRPVANLFENDRENNAFIKDIYKGINSKSEYAVISGCEVVKTSVNYSDYYEVKCGAFITGSQIYYIFPACEAAAKQIELDYSKVGGTGLTLEINYNYDTETYNYSYKNPVDSDSGAVRNAANLIYTLLNKIKIRYEEEVNGAVQTITKSLLQLGYNVEDSIILPIFKINSTTNIFFNNTVQANETIPTNSVKFATITNGNVDNTVKTLSTIDGSRIDTASGHKIKNSSLENNTIKIGSTEIALGASSASLANVTTINGVSLSSTSGLTITGSASAAITTTANYTLDTACTKAFTTDTTLASTGETAKLPTAATVKTYVDNKIQSVPRNSLITFNNGINVASGAASFASNITANGKLVINDATNASRVSNAVSGSASIYTKGGIEAKQNIYADGDIIGKNNGTYSLRSLKENITPFKKSAVKLINDVKIVNYNYITDPEKNHKVGFIADDTDELFATKNHNIMDQSNCIGILLKAVQELSGEVKKLKEEINELKSNNATGGKE